jgi:hypothetical protein
MTNLNFKHISTSKYIFFIGSHFLIHVSENAVNDPCLPAALFWDGLNVRLHSTK